MPSKLLFLPGASGDTQFWKPVSDLLVYPAAKVHIGYPGYGSIPPESDVNGFDDLVAKITSEIREPSALIAQSMGGVIAVLVALKKPKLITHLILTATSGGIDMAGLGAQDWRPSFLESNPLLPPWFSTYHEDLTPKLSTINIPTLLLWGTADPISPIEVGQTLASLLPHSALNIIPGGDHNLANAFAKVIAPLIDEHLLL